ncbi:uncharacterized protein L969DRAFT_96489 [Mixia osmundae IAM 14324]|uniref:Uncharacterized protein n=1 Tax=Mixia osmundae (strain CBS 9802 / IAM 14324 / JCM 22182 / KY 12970) TaxID=764103 RepID=G7DUW1_MIXOS|nr:uncharacterized protein L969DRAFT_96489 [Mixia osmundae IAM 14324]KEI37412.1 hypothetical protein L969DRAFT_96489 [Mixia osmundae IAM 14324]GAA94371.1 hypothetical protein E5Q_01022 [Mixia osmundae IAM 14324]
MTLLCIASLVLSVVTATVPSSSHVFYSSSEAALSSWPPLQILNSNATLAQVAEAGPALINYEITYSCRANCWYLGPFFISPHRPASISVELQQKDKRVEPQVSFSLPYITTRVALLDIEEDRVQLAIDVKGQRGVTQHWELGWTVQGMVCCRTYYRMKIWLHLHKDHYETTEPRVHRDCAPLITADSTRDCHTQYEATAECDVKEWQTDANSD